MYSTVNCEVVLTLLSTWLKLLQSRSKILAIPYGEFITYVCTFGILYLSVDLGGWKGVAMITGMIGPPGLRAMI